MSEFKIPQATIDAQNKAADPAVSAWVAANAGAGKTKVLADRVVRLLLAGTPPSRILCLTFTKAAAANMSLRILNLLADWVILEDDKLRQRLENLQGKKVKQDDLHAARRLFAKAVETPGGLKIETIHAFCERILHLAPFEARVPPQFGVAEEDQAQDLISQSIEILINGILDNPDTPLARAYHKIRSGIMGDGFPILIMDALNYISSIRKNGGLPPSILILRSVLGLSSDETLPQIQRNILKNGLSLSEYQPIILSLLAGKPTDCKQAAHLQNYMSAASFEDKWQHLTSFYFKKDGDPKSESRIVTKSVDDTIRSALVTEQERLIILRDKLYAAFAAEQTEALFILAEQIHILYSESKRRLSVLDFDDLISKTLNLLENTDASWILYKLDRGIDHILIDEAQDTSPEQWRILRKLTEEFSSGLGQSAKVNRTIFAVGDPKQSIYSFQGARPREFETSRRYWQQSMRNASRMFEAIELTLSFRSANAVLSAVDATFAVEENYSGLGFEDGSKVGTVHASARDTAPGLVEIWPTEQPLEAEEPEAGLHPVNAPDPASAPLLLAERIAKAVQQWTMAGDETGRIWKAGDILILVRKRGAAFEAVIRALKKKGIPVAGQDRLNITQHIAVQDLISVGRCTIRPEDDLALAESLKSPLCGFSDEDLERITSSGQIPLREALHRAALLQDEKAEQGLLALKFWQNAAKSQTPFGFYTTLLGTGGARAAFLARMGQEAADAIDAFLSFARSFELSRTASLAQFLAQFEKSDHIIKRDFEIQREEVRVMTIHGAKGLEAPLVVVIDGGGAIGKDPQIFEIETELAPSPLPLWMPSSHHDSCSMKDFRQQNRMQAEEEHHRLLYVAMTRAKDRLVIASHASGRSAQLSDNAWTSMIRKGIERSGRSLETISTSYGEASLWLDHSIFPAYSEQETIEEEKEDYSAPADPPPFWLHEPVRNEPSPQPPLRPSLLTASPQNEIRNLKNSSVLARQRGTLIHALLEHLPVFPEDKRMAAGHAFLAARAPHLEADIRNAMISQALSVINHDLLHDVFSGKARSEVPVSGIIRIGANLRNVSGRIDRLAVTDQAVIIADFKTDPHPPQYKSHICLSYRLQLAAYSALLEQIFPTKKIYSFLVYTAGPILWEITLQEHNQILENHWSDEEKAASLLD